MNSPAPPSRGRERDKPPYEPPPLRLVVHAEPAAVLIVRRSLRQWLDALAWPEPDSDDVVIAVNEACANAIEHAYPPEKLGRVEIDGRLVESVNQRQVTLVVHDGGRWQPHPWCSASAATASPSCGDACTP